MNPTPDPILAEALDFTANDLQLNRAGQMSDRQAEKVRSAGRNMSCALVFVALLILVPLTAMVISVLEAINQQDNLAIVFIGIGVLVVSVFAVSVLKTLGSSWRNAAQDTEQRQVVMVQGTVQCYTAGNKSTSYHLKIGELDLTVPRTAYIGFKHLEQYRLYYAPLSKKLLAAEPMLEDGSMRYEV
jgi:hypothetical protein